MTSAGVSRQFLWHISVSVTECYHLHSVSSVRHVSLYVSF